MLAAAGGIDEFLERYDVLLLADHGQTHVADAVRLQETFADLRLFNRRSTNAELVVTASNRAGMIYLLPACRVEPRDLASRLDGGGVAESVVFLEDAGPFSAAAEKSSVLARGRWLEDER